VDVAHRLDARPRIGPIADDVPDLDVLIDPERAQGFQRRFERLQVSVNVA
jgi:hypothetical protein